MAVFSMMTNLMNEVQRARLVDTYGAPAIEKWMPPDPFVKIEIPRELNLKEVRVGSLAAFDEATGEILRQSVVSALRNHILRDRAGYGCEGGPNLFDGWKSPRRGNPGPRPFHDAKIAPAVGYGEIGNRKRHSLRFRQRDGFQGAQHSVFVHCLHMA